MEIRLFKEFLLLSKILNFSRAAEQLGMAQPVLSRHIKYLEGEFGTQLLDRNTHKVELTPAGKLLAQEAAKIVAQYESAFFTIQSSLGKAKQKLSIAFLGEAVRELLASFLREFHEKHPGIAVEYYDIELDAVPRALSERQADIAFTVRPSSSEPDPRIRYIQLFSDPLCAAVRKDHPLARRRSISIHEVAQWPLIGIDMRVLPLAGECISHFLERYGINYEPVIACANLSTCCFNLEQHEDAIMVMPKHRRGLLGKNSVLLEISENDCQYSIELIWYPNNKNPSIDKFIKEYHNFSLQQERRMKTPPGWGDIQDSLMA